MSGLRSGSSSNGWIGPVDLWRSEEMQLVQLMLPSESAHVMVAALGDIGLLQFKDLNSDKSAFQRTHANQVKRCDAMYRKLRFMDEQLQKHCVSPVKTQIPVEALSFDQLEHKLEDLEREVNSMSHNTERLEKTHSELTELQLLIHTAERFFEKARRAASSQPRSAVGLSPSEEFVAPLLTEEPAFEESTPHKSGRLGFVTGLVQQSRLECLERLLFRATRGNMFFRSEGVGKVKDPASGEMQEKSVFAIFFSGDRARAKAVRICDAFGANRYPFPDDVQQQRKMASDVTSRLHDLHSTIAAGEMHLQNVLQSVAKNIEPWSLMVRKEKAIYHTLNKMSVDSSKRVLVAEAWIPMDSRERIQTALRMAAAQSSTAGAGAVVQPLTMGHQTPPTFFRTNKFTSCFQSIVDAYGIARYREVNPTVFTLMTFPFLFAVMFGDFGHGIIMLLFALFLVLNERKLGKAQLDDMSSMAFSGRYCILLMSCFSIYVGVIYNEFFSMPMTIFGPTHWRCLPEGQTEAVQMRDMRLCEGGVVWPEGQSPYPFGVDPLWRGTKTELPYLNSLKMKMSIVLGVTHMNLGIMMSLFNNAYFRDVLSTWCEFVPQMIFLNSLFGYLCLLIVGKWLSGSLADLYHVMIYMFLSPGTMDSSDPGYLFAGQGGLQVFLLLIALVAVPWMLIPKPYILQQRYKAALARTKGSAYSPVSGKGDDEESLLADGAGPSQAHGHGDHEGEFDFSEVLVHQMIHTIEFVLGAVSNTASYLRLWALSLAHSQLSAVFYDRVLMATVQSDSVIALFIGFFVFAMATMGVLMVMESLSAFLHALRLHWVEFQNKFYKGDGFQFTPFSFESLNDEEFKEA